MALVSIIVPCRNERRYIESFINSVLEQDTVGFDIEILIADGESNDGTRQILEQIAIKEPRVWILNNPKRITPAGLNTAIAASVGEIIVRLDVHTTYASNYVRMCVETLIKTEASNVGGPWCALGKSYLQRVIALAFQSPFSAGGAKSHALDYEGPVDTVYLGCWRRSVFQQFGFFDEELVRNQDDEHNLRILRGGGGIWQNPAIQSWYSPRSSIGALFRQYLQYGYWKVRVIQKHRLPASWRHLVPGAFVISLSIASIGALVHPWGQLALATLLGIYGTVSLAASLSTCARAKSFQFLPLLPPVFAAYHLGYGIGFLAGLIDFIVLKRRRSPRFSGLTRS